jgi:hypothetical protein
VCPCKRGSEAPAGQGRGSRPCRTLMRSPFVKRQTVPRSGFFVLVPLLGARAVAIWQRVLTSFPSAGADATCLHHTRMEALSP